MKSKIKNKANLTINPTISNIFKSLHFPVKNKEKANKYERKKIKKNQKNTKKHTALLALKNNITYQRINESDLFLKINAVKQGKEFYSDISLILKKQSQ